MIVSKRRLILIVLFCLNWELSLSSICKKGEEPFVILNFYNNKIYADGKEIATGTIIGQYLPYQPITAFCIPFKTRLIAVTNVLDQHPGAYLFGSLGEKLVTDREWRCVEKTSDGNWYRVEFDDRKWPQAHEYPAPAVMPNISRNALSISSSPAPSKKYHCRAWIGGRPSIEEVLTRSAYATRVGMKQRLNFNLIRSFLVSSIIECVTHCLGNEKCHSVNFENSGNGHNELKRCELNSENKDISRANIVVSNEFDYYHVIKP